MYKDTVLKHSFMSTIKDPKTEKDGVGHICPFPVPEESSTWYRILS